MNRSGLAGSFTARESSFAASRAADNSFANGADVGARDSCAEAAADIAKASTPASQTRVTVDMAASLYSCGAVSKLFYHPAGAGRKALR
jgi:hypothetical protein